MDSVLREKWFELSLVQQMINIGNEVKRGMKFSSDPEKKYMFFERAIQYTQLTMENPQNKQVLPELLISKKVLEDYCEEHKFDCTGEQILSGISKSFEEAIDAVLHYLCLDAASIFYDGSVLSKDYVHGRC